MFTTVNRAGIEILINPAHVAAVINTPDGPEIQMVTGKTFSVPPGEYPIIRAALDAAPRTMPAWLKEWKDLPPTSPRISSKVHNLPPLE